MWADGPTFTPQLLTARLPFTASDVIGWVHCHVARKPAPPVRFRDALPSVLSEIVLKLLAKVPDRHRCRPLPKIFDRFERAVSTTHYGGLGLGLYLARSIVESHGGAITVDSRVDEGSTFTVRLPRTATRPTP